ncbi:MAG: hypothetical protein EKK55_05980 [Rhodocyclaceae bacterium]|nr:MAG: hypothetical protein EKK55_05980 [Rhodocyclaceae bacterium]
MPASTTYTLIAPAAPAVQPSSEVLDPLPPAAQPSARRGVLRPFRFGADGNPVTGTGEALRTSRVAQVLGTTSRGPRSAGELRWNGAFGSQLERLRQSSFDDAKAALTVIYARDALARPLPTEIVEKADVVVDGENIDVTLYTRQRGVLRSHQTAVATSVKVKG